MGLTGSREKAEIARARYGYEEMIDYRQEPDVALAIKRGCPQGNDIFFDNTGGIIADAAIRSMRLNGRVIQCGTAANASWSPTPTGPRQEREILTRRLRWSGFIIFDHIAEFPAEAADLTQLAARKEIVFDEEILIGLDRPHRLERLGDVDEPVGRERLADERLRRQPDRVRLLMWASGRMLNGRHDSRLMTGLHCLS